MEEINRSYYERVIQTALPNAPYHFNEKGDIVKVYVSFNFSFLINYHPTYESWPIVITSDKQTYAITKSSADDTDFFVKTLQNFAKSVWG